jgi:thiol:disulfide interchange protein DsbD
MVACALPALAAGQATVTAKPDRSTAKPGETLTLNVVITVAEGFHAQSHKPSAPNYIPLVLTPTPNAAVDFGTIEYPPGVDETYPDLGTLNVYTGEVTVRVPVTIKPGTAGGEIKLAGSVRYQACDDRACYRPERAPFETTLAIDAPAGASPPAAVSTPVTAPADTELVEAPQAFGLRLSPDAYLLPFAAAFLVGIVFNAVPCVLPVVPLKIAGFYEAAQHDRRKCFLLGMAFSLGLVAVFVALAVLVIGLKAMTWGELFTNSYFTAGIVAVLLVMALSQFGLFTINLPTAAYAYTPRHDTYVGNALFGGLTAVLSTPCTIGPFSGLLAWTITQPPLAGSAMLVIVGCGMAFPYLVLSAFPQVVRRFPRTGPVGEIIKQTLAFLVLATAFYFARPFLNQVFTPPAFWWTLFAIVAAAGVFLVVRTIQRVGTPRAVWISGATAAVLVGAALFGTLKFASNPYDWQPYTDQALADARASGRTVLIDFTADWCVNCHYLEAFVLNDARIVQAVRDDRIVMLKADVTHGNEPAVPLKDKLVPTGEIPLTAVYPTGLAEPALLKGVYSTSDLLNVLAETKR